MSESSLKKFILAPVIISASVFATLTLPLAFLGNKPVAIQVQQGPMFYGQLRDVMTPYLGLVGVLSLGAGAASVAIAGWQQSSRKSEQVEAQLSGLAQHLQEKEAQLEALKLSEARLEASGLKAFLDEEDSLELSNPTPTTPAITPLVVEEFVMAPQLVEAQVLASPTVTLQATTAKFACAQTFLGYVQGKGMPNSSTRVSESTHQEVERLQAQLQELMAQMVSLQAALAQTGHAVQSQAQPLGKASPMQVTKPWSVN